MSDVQAKKKKQMLSSYSIVFLVLIVVAILTWFVPQSVVCLLYTSDAADE